MVRLSRIALLLFACIGFTSCQSNQPGLQEKVTRVDETAVIGALGTIATAQQSYAVTNGGDYGTFQQLYRGDYLDARFNADQPEVKGYVLSMLTQKSEGEPPKFSCNADPIQGETGRHFYIDSTSAVIRVNPSQRASGTDPILQP